MALQAKRLLRLMSFFFFFLRQRALRLLHSTRVLGACFFLVCGSRSELCVSVCLFGGAAQRRAGHGHAKGHHQAQVGSIDRCIDASMDRQMIG
eukprot:3332210-Rhodomonas_salina.1